MRPPTYHLGEGPANELLAQIPDESIRLVNTSPRYLDLIDYDRAHGREGWRPGQAEPLLDYADEHLRTCAELARVTHPDSVVAVEIDDYRVPRQGRIVRLPDLWADMLEAVGFRVAERITLVRTLAIGHRSGHFKRYRGKAGYFLPDNVTSQVLVAFKGDPMARLRRDGTPDDRIQMAWAQPFLRTAWTVRPPDSRGNPGHPAPQDAEIARAVLRFYSLMGDTVLDPFAGSGTTGVVAAELGRSAVLFERVPRFAALIRERVPAVRPYALRGRRVVIPSAQLLLDLGDATKARLRRAFLDTTTLGDISDRLQGMADVASELTGVQIPPELLAIVLRAERAHYKDQRAARKAGCAA